VRAIIYENGNRIFLVHYTELEDLLRKIIWKNYEHKQILDRRKTARAGLSPVRRNTARRQTYSFEAKSIKLARSSVEGSVIVLMFLLLYNEIRFTGQFSKKEQGMH
jgi:hypothetical protein